METVVSTSHQGYRPNASACPVRCGLHAADLANEEPEGPLKAFIALDYFFDRAHASTFAPRSGHI